MLCRNCNQELGTNAFCPNCGTPAVTTCPQCGTQHNANFCTTCGAAAPGTQPAPPPQEYAPPQQSYIPPQSYAPPPQQAYQAPPPQQPPVVIHNHNTNTNTIRGGYYKKQSCLVHILLLCFTGGIGNIIYFFWHRSHYGH